MTTKSNKNNQVTSLDTTEELLKFIEEHVASNMDNLQLLADEGYINLTYDLHLDHHMYKLKIKNGQLLVVNDYLAINSYEGVYLTDKSYLLKLLERKSSQEYIDYAKRIVRQFEKGENLSYLEFIYVPDKYDKVFYTYLDSITYSREGSKIEFNRASKSYLDGIRIYTLPAVPEDLPPTISEKTTTTKVSLPRKEVAKLRERIVTPPEANKKKGLLPLQFIPLAFVIILGILIVFYLL